MSSLITWDIKEAVVRGSKRVLLYGPPGTGKTTAAIKAAKALNIPIYMPVLDGEMSPDMLKGFFIPVGGGKYKWFDAPAMEAFRNGGMFIVNEVEELSSEVQTALSAFADDSEVASITVPYATSDGKDILLETIFPHPDFRMVMTMNGMPDDLKPKLRDRFSIMLEVTEPHPDAVASLPEDLQAQARSPESYDRVERPATMRTLKAFAEQREIHGPEIAAAIIFGNRGTEVMDAIRLADDRKNVVAFTPSLYPQLIRTGDWVTIDPETVRINGLPEYEGEVVSKDSSEFLLRFDNGTEYWVPRNSVRRNDEVEFTIGDYVSFDEKYVDGVGTMTEGEIIALPDMDGDIRIDYMGDEFYVHCRDYNVRY